MRNKAMSAIVQPDYWGRSTRFAAIGALDEPPRLAAEGRGSMPRPRLKRDGEIEVQVRKPSGHSGH
jgi:hypothetical protein